MRQFGGVSHVSHYEELERINPVCPGDRLATEVYSTALDHLVIACVDAVLICEQQVLLAKRNRYPRPSWWIIGGRMTAGENPEAAICRQVANETKLTGLQPDRFTFIGVYSTCFAFRHQPPSHHGSHTLNLTYQIELTAAEKAQIHLQADEHATWSWVNFDRLSSLLDGNQVMDRALLQILQDCARRG
jgi:8-oxo-dGTP pyrophosphatase MutT (NUDIX family)